MKKSSLRLVQRTLYLFIFLFVFFILNSQNLKIEEGLLFYKNPEGVNVPVKSKADWKKKKAQILQGMENAMGKLPDRTGLPEFDLQILETLDTIAYSRLTISFKAAEGERVPAYLYIPVKKKSGKKLPAMVVLHGTGVAGKRIVDGYGPLPNRALAKELAQRGYVVIAPDYPSMGDLVGYDFNNDRYESGTMKAIFNHMRCVDLLQSMKEVDGKRIGVIGHSLGGHNSMFLGAFDQRIKVIVSSCGWTLMDYYDIGKAASEKFGGRLGPWAQDRYMPLLRTKYNLDPEKIPFDFDEIIAAFAPRAFFSNSPINDSNFSVTGCEKGITSAIEVYRFFKAENNLQIRYPEAEHDFPEEVRMEAYRFIDKILKHNIEE